MILSRFVKKWVALAAAMVVAMGGTVIGAEPVLQHAPGSPFVVGSARVGTMAFGDLNGDGAVDFIAQSPTNSAVWVAWFNDGTGRFSESGKTTTAPYTVGSYRPVLADLNHDGILDLVANGSGPNVGFGNGAYGVYVWGGRGDGSFNAYRGYRAGSFHDDDQVGRSVAVADMNLDGHMDLVVAGIGWVSVLPGKGDGTFPVEMPTAIGPGALSLAEGVAPLIVDWNNDGAPDVVVKLRNSQEIRLVVFLNDGTGKNFVQEGVGVVLPTGPSTGDDAFFRIGDFDGDGRQDCLVQYGGHGLATFDYQALTRATTRELWTVGSVYHNPNFVYGLYRWPGAAGLTFDESKMMVRLAPIVYLSDGVGGFKKGGFTQGVVDANNPVFGLTVDMPNAFYLDVNGDGKLDVVDIDSPVNGSTTNNVLLNTTAGTFVPRLEQMLPAGGRAGVAFNYKIQALGTAPITITATGLPAGLSLSGNTIVGTPSAAGSTAVTVKASNSAGTDTRTLRIAIQAAGQGNKPPVVEAGPNAANVTIGQVYQLAGSVSDDGLPADPGRVKTRWIVADDSGDREKVVFDDPRSPTTTVRFIGSPLNGTAFTLVLTADDGQYVVKDQVDIIVIPGSAYPRVYKAPTYLNVDEGTQASFVIGMIGAGDGAEVRIERVSGDPSVEVLTGSLHFGPNDPAEQTVFLRIGKDLDRIDGFATLKMWTVQPNGAADPLYKNLFVEVRDLYAEGGGGGTHGPGDVNGDGVVNQLDLSEVIANFGNDYR